MFRLYHKSFMNKKQVISMNKQLRSVYAEHITAFVKMKRTLGFKYTTGEVILTQIDRVADERRELSQGITKSFSDFWREKRPNESDSYRYDRVRFLHQFSAYLNDLGVDSYTPRLLPYRDNNFQPYIFTHDQILGLFSAMDSMTMGHRSTNSSSLFAMPALLRFLYGTGLRVGEVISLKNEDVCFDQNYIRVKDSKNGKERVLPISKSLSLVCKEYDDNKKLLARPKDESGYFFISPNGQKCSYQGVSRWFKKCINKSDTIVSGVKHIPRLHDLRHTFAVTSMAKMAGDGIDLYVSLPVLSTYLGHGSIQATNHYVRLTARIYPDLIRDVDQVTLDLFPKSNYYETN